MKLAWIIIMWMFISCSSGPYLKGEKRIPIRSKTINDLEGRYIDSNLSHLLPGASVMAVRPSSVEIKVQDKKMLKLSLLVRDSVISTSLMKGKFRNGYFITSKTDISFPLGIIWRYGRDKNYFGITETDRLVFASSTSAILFLVFFPVGGAEDHEILQYSRGK